MQESNRAAGETQSRLPNPFLDFAIAGLESQLKAWQAFQVEGTLFVAKRMRCDLEHLRALGHCCDIESTGECQRAWLHDTQKDYAEEWGRVVATSFALAFGELSGFGWLLGQRMAKGSSNSPSGAKSDQRSTPQPGFQAAA